MWARQQFYVPRGCHSAHLGISEGLKAGVTPIRAAVQQYTQRRDRSPASALGDGFHGDGIGFELLAGLWRSNRHLGWQGLSDFGFLRPLAALPIRQLKCFVQAPGIEEALEDAQVVARGVVEEWRHPVAGGMKQPAHPIKFSDNDIARMGAPLMGQDTDDVLTMLGYDQQQILALRTAGSVA